jgi:hypothetical protein
VPAISPIRIFIILAKLLENVAKLLENVANLFNYCCKIAGKLSQNCLKMYFDIYNQMSGLYSDQISTTKLRNTELVYF